MPESVYIETTIVSYLTARPSRDLVMAAHQRTTRDWWDSQRHRFELLTSDLVILEASAGDKDAAAERLEVLGSIPLVQPKPESAMLAEALLAAAALPSVASRDALHVAIAAVNGLDYLMTWNCTHLANATLRARIERVCGDACFRPPITCTPEELFEDRS